MIYSILAYISVIGYLDIFIIFYSFILSSLQGFICFLSQCGAVMINIDCFIMIALRSFIIMMLFYYLFIRCFRNFLYLLSLLIFISIFSNVLFVAIVILVREDWIFNLFVLVFLLII